MWACKMLCGYRMSAMLRLLELCAWQWQLLLGSSHLLVPTHRSPQPALIQGTIRNRDGQPLFALPDCVFPSLLAAPHKRQVAASGQRAFSPHPPWAIGAALLWDGAARLQGRRGGKERCGAPCRRCRLCAALSLLVQQLVRCSLMLANEKRALSAAG